MPDALKRGVALTIVLMATHSPLLVGQSLSYLALGDSYTIGESVSPDRRWPVQLADTLRSLGYPVARPEIVAVTGWTTDELLTGIEEESLNEPYELVSLLIGVNNQYRGYDIDRYRTEFTELLNRSIRFAGGRSDHVLVLSIPDYGVTPFAEDRGLDPSRIASELDRYNRINRKISGEMGVLYVDIAPLSRQAGEDDALLADDGLHPSGTMYGTWVKQILPVLIPELDTWEIKR